MEQKKAEVPEWKRKQQEQLREKEEADARQQHDRVVLQAANGKKTRIPPMTISWFPRDDLPIEQATKLVTKTFMDPGELEEFLNNQTEKPTSSFRFAVTYVF